MYRTATMCRVLGVSSSGYYAWRRRAPCARSCADRALTKRIQAIHERSRGTYGVPRVHAELEAEGVRVGRKRVARLMRGAGLAGVSRRKGARTTQRRQEARPAPDLVDRNFTAEAPDRLWVADITYVPTWAGFLYLAVALDAFSRRIVGWSMATHLRAELVLDALDMALYKRRPRAVIHHSDHGARSTPRSPLGSAAGRRACVPPWVRSGTATTTRCVRAFSPRWSASSSLATVSAPGPRRAWRCSGSSRASTTRIVGTPPSTTCHPLTTKGDNNAHPENPSA